MGRAAGEVQPVPAASVRPVGIEEAARLVGASPSALREWERQGLVRPARTAGGSRRYLRDDVERLQRIRAWRTVDGLNAAAIRRLLDSSAALGGHGDMARPPEVHDALSVVAAPTGSRLREMRRSCGHTLREAAHRSGLSVSFISSLERGVTGASITTLRRLVEAYGRTVGDLVQGPVPSTDRLIRPAARRVLDAGSGIRIEDLSATPAALESQLFILAPGATSDGLYRHAGEEFMYVLAGLLGVWLDEPHGFYRLEPGDALTFPSTVDHRIMALGQAETRVLWVNTPPTF